MRHNTDLLHPEVFQAIDCDGNDCKFSTQLGVTTLMAETPYFNKNGQLYEPKGNHTSGNIFCETCGKVWKYETFGYSGRFNIEEDDRFSKKGEG